MITVPVLAGIQSHLRVVTPSLADATILSPPLLRFYLAVTLLAIAQALYFLWCPAIVRDYESFRSWQADSSEFAAIWQRQLREQGADSTPQILEALKGHYHTERASKNTARRGARLMLSFLYGGSSLLLVYTLLRHLLVIFSDTDNIRALVR